MQCSYKSPPCYCALSPERLNKDAAETNRTSNLLITNLARDRYNSSTYKHFLSQV